MANEPNPIHIVIPERTIQWQGEWNVSVTYYKNSIVECDGSAWVAKRTTTGEYPQYGSDAWDEFLEGGVAGLPGPAGPQGPAGPKGQPRFSGVGPPPLVIEGAEPEDVYLDLVTGDTYKLV